MNLWRQGLQDPAWRAAIPVGADWGSGNKKEGEALAPPSKRRVLGLNSRHSVTGVPSRARNTEMRTHTGNSIHDSKPASRCATARFCLSRSYSSNQEAEGGRIIVR